MARKQQSGKPAGAVAIPAGFVQTRTGNFPDEHDFKKNPTLQGTVSEVKTVPFKKGKKTEQRKIATITDSDGVVVTVWESASLRGMFAEMKPGDDVFVHYNGLKKIKGKPQPMKDFITAVKARGAKKGRK